MTQSPALLRFGMIGCGALGLVHAERLSAIPGVQVAALSDPSPAAMQNINTLLVDGPTNGPALPEFTDYRDMLAHVELDAVCISSPNRLHVEQLLASVGHGLHVLCEKPLSLYPAEVTEVVEATQRAKRAVAIAYQSRYRRDARILRYALQSGKWGPITSVNIFSSEGLDHAQRRHLATRSGSLPGRFLLRRQRPPTGPALLGYQSGSDRCPRHHGAARHPDPPSPPGAMPA